MRIRSVKQVLVLSAFGGALAACGAEPANEDSPVDAPSPPTSPAADGGTVFTGPDNTPSTPNECGGVTVQAKRIPLSVVIAFDRSNSMGKANKWEAGVAGMTAYLEAPHADVSASLAFFPQAASSCAGDFTNPKVPLTALPATNFATAFAKTSLLGGTPTAPALQGAIAYARRLQTGPAAQGRVVIALVTDGAPSINLCSPAKNDIATIAALAAAANVDHGVLTFAIGMDGASEANLDKIALAGGTTKSTLVDPAQGATQLTQTFERIQSEFACDVVLPPIDAVAGAGKPYTLDQVNVVFEPTGGTPATLLYSKDCANPEGWQYDDPAKPTRIELCAKSCAQGRANVGILKVKLGCKTEGEIPR